jgi:hypothetical protein
VIAKAYRLALNDQVIAGLLRQNHRMGKRLFQALFSVSGGVRTCLPNRHRPPDGPVMAGQLSPDPAQRIGHFLGDFPFDPKLLEFSCHQAHPDIQEGERLRFCL